MIATDTYRSISAESRGAFRDKASKFISVAVPVDSEEEVRTRLEGLRKEFFDANHHCFAYRLGPDGARYRVYDDGEPSGSAGRPIYGQILSAGLSDILIVVIRYFGGTKLGIPGLIHAYRTAAEEAIRRAGISEKTLTEEFETLFPYSGMNGVMKILKESGAKVLRLEHGDPCRVRFRVRKSLSEEVQNKFMKASYVSTCLYTG
jgi:uncharacterized YigZ family protein